MKKGLAKEEWGLGDKRMHTIHKLDMRMKENMLATEAMANEKIPRNLTLPRKVSGVSVSPSMMVICVFLYVIVYFISNLWLWNWMVRSVYLAN